MILSASVLDFSFTMRSNLYHYVLFYFKLFGLGILLHCCFPPFTHSSIDCLFVCLFVCVSSDLRLANGGSHMSGRVEIMYGGHWGTVCDHSWNVNAGNVVCRVLGYRRAEAVRSFGKGTGQIFLDKVRCQGDEPSLSFCRHLGWTANQDCTHDNDAGVVCTDGNCTEWFMCNIIAYIKAPSILIRLILKILTYKPGEWLTDRSIQLQPNLTQMKTYTR